MGTGRRGDGQWQMSDGAHKENRHGRASRLASKIERALVTKKRQRVLDKEMRRER